jgi:hypothetical protein
MIKLILVTAGIAWIFTRSKIFKPLREFLSLKQNLYSIAIKSTEFRNKKNNLKYNFYTFWDNLFECHGCFGFWVAGVVSVYLKNFTCEIWMDMCIGSISSLILISLAIFLEKR